MPDMGWITSERLRRVGRFLWAAVLVALPVTSFRYLPFMGSDTQVRPLSLIPAVLLLPVLVLRCFRERRFLLWNRHFQPLLVFILFAVISSAAGFLFAPVDIYSYTYSNRVVRAWLSLGIGMIFLVTAMSMNQDEQDLRFTMKWIYVGFIAEVLWSLVQFQQIYLTDADPNLLDTIQKTIMMAGLSPNGRINGLALEPSWLAAQILTIYLPWAFASVLKNYYWGKHRWTLTAILAACAFLLIFTFSRGGILIAFAALFLTFLITGWDRIRQSWRWFISPLRSKSISSNRLLEVGLRWLLIVAILAGLSGGIHVLSRNPYFAQIWESEKGNVVDYFVDIYAGPRLAYTWAGWAVFEQHPWTGVGLGAAGFYLIKALPDWAHFNMSEIAQLLSSDNQTFPNAKNIYVRLLSETGILGFWSFISLFLLMLGKILSLLRSKRKDMAFLGVAGLLAWFSIVMLGFTQDSFAMPTIWLPLGILMGISDKGS
jgi:O-antigen ligase